MDELKKIDLNLFVVLYALLTEKHVTRAAQMLNRSQPAVSHSLSQLRIIFNDPLLIRKGGHMFLSAKAEGLINSLENSLLGLNSILEVPEFNSSQARGRFRIALSDYASQIILPKLMHLIRHEAPGIELAISQASRESMLVQLVDGELDLALGIFPDIPEEIQVQTLFEEKFISLADKASLPKRGKLSLEDWLKRPHVMVALKPDANDEIEKALTVLGFKRSISLVLPHWGTAVSVIPGTDLILTIASKAVGSLQNYESLKKFEAPLDLPQFKYQQAWHIRKELNPAHQWLRDAIKSISSN